MAYELSNCHVTDDVKWPWKVKLVTPIRLELNISKTFQRTSKWHGKSNGHVTYVARALEGATRQYGWLS